MTKSSIYVFIVANLLLLCEFILMSTFTSYRETAWQLFPFLAVTLPLLFYQLLADIGVSSWIQWFNAFHLFLIWVTLLTELYYGYKLADVHHSDLLYILVGLAILVGIVFPISIQWMFGASIVGYLYYLSRASSTASTAGGTSTTGKMLAAWIITAFCLYTVNAFVPSASSVITVLMNGLWLLVPLLIFALLKEMKVDRFSQLRVPWTLVLSLFCWWGALHFFLLWATVAVFLLFLQTSVRGVASYVLDIVWTLWVVFVPLITLCFLFIRKRI